MHLYLFVGTQGLARLLDFFAHSSGVQNPVEFAQIIRRIHCGSDAEPQAEEE